MKTPKNEYTYLFLSLVTLALISGLYLTFGRNFGAQTSTTSQKTTVSSSSTTEKTISEEEQQIIDLEAAIAELEKTPAAEDLATIQEQVNALTDETKKAEFQTRLDAVAVELENQAAAETAVANAEGYQVPYNAEVAQAAIDLVSNQTKKAELQARLDVVNEVIQVYYYGATTTSQQ